MRSILRLASVRYLALTAALLLSLAPTIGRLLAVQSAGAGWVQLCTMSGLKQVWSDGAPIPSPDHQGDGDCAYCPLLSALLGVATVFWLAASEQRAPLREASARSLVIAVPACGSLGPRGPPRPARLILAI